jgi:plasmid stabilization system protein ParE
LRARRVSIASRYSYRLHPEIGDDARMAVIGRYVVLFHIVNDIARIERVVYGGRELWAMFNEVVA